MAKTKPIGVRFDIELSKKFDDMGISSPQRVLNFLEDFYLKNIEKVIEVNNKPENKKRILNEREGLVEPKWLKQMIEKNTPPFLNPLDNLEVIEENVPRETNYDFTGKSFLVVEDYTKYPMKDIPKNKWEASKWLNEKTIADLEIKKAWVEYKKN